MKSPPPTASGDRLRELSAKATAGEWQAFGDEADWPGIEAFRTGRDSESIVIYGEPEEDQAGVRGGNDGQDLALAKANVAFIVAAVNFVREELSELLTSRDAALARVAELESERDEARKVAQDLSWMARRYADGRRSYAVGMCNDALRKGYEGGWIHPICNGVDEKWARDGDELFERMAQEERLRSHLSRSDREER